MIVVGIDPGATGAVALLTPERLRVWDIPTHKVKRGKRTVNEVQRANLAAVVDSATKQEPDLIVIEKVASMADQGRASIFAFGKGFGILLGALAYAGYAEDEIMEVPPSTWKRAMGCGSNKESSLVQCLDRFGTEYRHLWFGERMGVLDGRCEAALLAAYGRDWHGKKG